MKKLKLTKVQSAAKAGGANNYTIRYAEELNPAQYEAVMHKRGAALVIAGAGTGKTRTLIYRVARLVEDGVAPESILLLTFTRKSSAEMLRRATLLLDGRCEQVSGGTFHSFAHQVLRRRAASIGFDSNFSVLDQSDAEDVINLLRGRIFGGSSKRRFPRKQTLFAVISAAVNCRMSIGQVLENDYPHYSANATEIEFLAQEYSRYKRVHNLMDYDDLLLHVLSLLKENDEARRWMHRRYKHILVDEYQDTNSLQHEIVLHLAGKHENVLAVGDDAQSIYSFRGANFRNILNFPQSFTTCAIIKLEENYRSTQPILDLTNEIIMRAGQKFEKELYARTPGEELPAIIRAENEQQQSEFVAARVLELREEGVPLMDIAVLFRSGFHSFDLEIALQKANIPHRKFGGFKFVETAHVKDVMAHLRVLVNPKDAVSWNRILLLLDGVGPKTAGTLVDAIVDDSLSLQNTGVLTKLVRGDAAEHLFGVLKKASAERMAVDAKINLVMEYYRPILKKKHEDYNKRMRDLEALLGIAERYRSLNSLLADMVLEAPVETVDDILASDQDDEYLTLSTIHSAKGLEWNTVFIIWALDGRFPPVRAFQTDESLEEERRLLYVACTRAREHLYISYPVNIYDRETGMVLGSPSRFLQGLPEKLYDEFVIDFDEER